jgi:type I restriction enzyme, S subunit
MSDWKATTLGEIVAAGGGKIQTGPFGSQLHASDYVDEGVPCIMPTNLKNNRVDLAGIAFISQNDANRLSQHLVREGDIVYSRRGDVTQKALIRKGEAGYFCGTGCLLVRPGTIVDPEFLT